MIIDLARKLTQKVELAKTRGHAAAGKGPKGLIKSLRKPPGAIRLNY